MEHQITQLFKATINQTTIENEWIYNALVSIIERIENKFNVDVTNQFIQDLNDAMEDHYHHYRNSTDEIEHELFNSTYQKTEQEIVFKIYNESGLFNTINETIKHKPYNYFKKRFTTREKQDLLLSAMIYGVDFKVDYGMIAPYDHAYRYRITGESIQRYSMYMITTRQYWVETLPETLRRYLEREYPDYDYESLKKRLSNINNTIKFGNETNVQIANGYEQNKTKETIENILKGHHQGTGSTMTPVKQNELAILLTAIKYCHLIKISEKLNKEVKAILERIVPYVGE